MVRIPFKLDRTKSESLVRQMTDNLRDAIETGFYKPVEKPSAAAKGAATVYVGAAFARKRFPEDFKAIGATDGFAVPFRLKNPRIVVVK